MFARVGFGLSVVQLSTFCTFRSFPGVPQCCVEAELSPQFEKLTFSEVSKVTIVTIVNLAIVADTPAPDSHSWRACEPDAASRGSQIRSHVPHVIYYDGPYSNNSKYSYHCYLQSITMIWNGFESEWMVEQERTKHAPPARSAACARHQTSAAVDASASGAGGPSLAITHVHYSSEKHDTRRLGRGTGWRASCPKPNGPHTFCAK